MEKITKPFIELLNQFIQIDVSTYDIEFLNSSLIKRMLETHCNSTEDYYDFLLKNPDECLLFIDSLQVCYSEFFRNSLTFSVLEKIIIPEIIMNKQQNKLNEIRVWSSACASGQECYSLAMLLKEYSNGKKINFRIFATDQSPKQIEEAKKGAYSYSALGSVSVKRKDNWFTQKGNVYLVKDELKKCIDFSTFDLLGDEFSSPPSSIFGDFDLVVCANLLFYYKPEYRNRIVRKLSNSLSVNGFLVTGETERDILTQHHFREVIPQSAVFKK